MNVVKEKWTEIIEHLRIEHELSNVNKWKYGFADFFKLPVEPAIASTFEMRLLRIATPLLLPIHHVV